MSDNKKLKKAARERQKRTGESYTTALMHVRATHQREQQVQAVGLRRGEHPLLVEIREALEAHPELTYRGFVPGGQQGSEHLPPTTIPVELERDRDRLLGDDSVQQIEACLSYLSPIRKLRTAKAKEDEYVHGSYGLKHEVEAWLKQRGTPGYIANGSFIVAALIAGFRIHRVDHRSPNCLVGVHQEDVRAAREGKDPRQWRKLSRFVKWLFAQAGRQDPVGDLSGDCLYDFSFPRRGNAATVGAYLSRYGEHIGEAFAQAVAEYRREHGMGPLRILTVAETSARLEISEFEVTEDWLESGSFPGARQDASGRWTIPELDVLIAKNELKRLREYRPINKGGKPGAL